MVWFDRASAFLFDVSLKSVDMALIFGGYVQVSFHEDYQTPVPSQVLAVLKQHYGEEIFNSYTFVQVKSIRKQRTIYVTEKGSYRKWT